MVASLDSFRTRRTLAVSGREYDYFALPATGRDLSRVPVSLRILLENLLRREDGRSVREEDIAALLAWSPAARTSREIAFMPARVLLQDFTGVPAVVDLAAMRDALVAMGGDPKKINPLQPVDLVIDHSVQVDHFGSPQAFGLNAKIEAARNRERYQFLRWGQKAFDNFRVVPPDTGIVHQVNLEYLASVVMAVPEGGRTLLLPDTLVGTDSHTTMVNGLGVLGWGVGGIEAEAAMLGQASTMLVPEVVGFRLRGKLAPGATATDLVLTATQMLRKHGVVGKFVEYFGEGVCALSIADRATLANMAPEYGATMGFFPVDAQTLAYLRFSGRSDEQVALVEAYCKAQGIFHTPETPEPRYSSTIDLDLATVEPSLAGPKRPQDRVALKDAKASFAAALPGLVKGGAKPDARAAIAGETEIGHGAVVIAAITSCTNTSNPSVLVAAGLLAKKAVARGLSRKPWVKTSLAPGSKVVTRYLDAAGLSAPLAKLGFDLVGYGCTTCIGNSGPLPEEVAAAIEKGGLVAAAVLSGNRNFEGRVNPLCRANYLASPPLVVAYAIAGSMDVNLATEPLGTGDDGQPVYLRDVWPTTEEIEATVRAALGPKLFREEYADVFGGDALWKALPVPEGTRYAWDRGSTYIQRAPFFDGLPRTPAPLAALTGARALAVFGDSITTDHISPAGNIAKDGPAGRYLQSLGVAPEDFNSFGARRGNHEVMVRGTFANIRIKNLLAAGAEGGVTVHQPSGEKLSIYDAAMRYQREGVPLVVLAGKEYGTGSSRDWAAKGPRLLGVRAVIAESFERIHRSNLVGMGILPLQFQPGENVASLGLTGREVFAIPGVGQIRGPGGALAVEADGRRFSVLSRIDTPEEVEYLRHGGILQYVLRQLLG